MYLLYNVMFISAVQQSESAICVLSRLVMSWWPHALYSPPGSFVRGISQARILEWVAISFSRASSWPRDQTQVSCIAGRFFTIWASREAHRRVDWDIFIHQYSLSPNNRPSATLVTEGTTIHTSSSRYHHRHQRAANVPTALTTHQALRVILILPHLIPKEIAWGRYYYPQLKDVVMGSQEVKWHVQHYPVRSEKTWIS